MLQSKPVNKENEGVIESVHIKYKGFLSPGTKKTVCNFDVFILIKRDFTLYNNTFTSNFESEV